MAGKLYLCATPIGNLEDITFRVLNTLKEVDLIAAEDTRHSIKLLNHFGIKTPMTSYHEFNKVEKARYLVEQLKEGHKTYDVLIEEGIKGNLVDIELFSKAMKKYYKEVGKTKPHSVINNTKKRLENKNKALYDSLVGNIETLDKLWKDLGI